MNIPEEVRVTKKIYIIGALKNDNIPKIAAALRPTYDVFDQWITPGPEADQFLFQYAKQRGWNYKEALTCFAARNNFEFDKRHIDSSDIVVMVMPAGKSAHLELGYAIGMGKEAHILFDAEPDRFDLMYNFVPAYNIHFNLEQLSDKLFQKV
jgi:hypothetical protein